MSQETRSPSLVVRFLDSFLQERNIKWVLVVGMSILLGSSLLLVTTHWDTYTLLWQNVIVLGYSVAIHAAGQWTYRRLGLRRTGTVLQGLTVLLIPVLFLAIHWLPDRGLVESPPPMLQGLLFAGTAAFAIPAARRIFALFLRSTQPTFLVCYLLLAMSGALLPLTPPALAPLVVAGLWGAFAIGSVKVSRHVFWLTEEHRAPRIYGFLPIAILGAQFLCLYGVHPELHVGLDWIGFGCVLAAIPILATADALARVFEQRTGGLVRPLPWSILTPVLAGLILCSAGMVLSGSGLMHDEPPAAFLATALATSGLMLLLARRTGKEAFVWAMLIGLTIAYNTSPRFFVEAVNALKAHGATAVRESKLPIAFYGLTYLPLLTTLLVAGKLAVRSGCELFARPMRLFGFGLTCLLWAGSLTHEKAMFPVGVVLVGVAVAQLRVLRFWPALFLGLLAWVSAAFGLSIFAEKVLELTALANLQLLSLVAASALLLAIGELVDAPLRRLFPDWLARCLPNPVETTSLLLALALVPSWFAASNFLWAGILLAGLLTAHAARRGNAALAAGAILFAQAVVIRTLIVAGLSPSRWVSIGTMVLLGEWLIGSALERFGRGPTIAMFTLMHQRITAAWLLFVAAAIHLPMYLFEYLHATRGLSLVVLPAGIDWPCRVAMLLWTFDLVRRWRSIVPAVLVPASVLGIVTSAWIAFAHPVAPMELIVVWAATGLTMLIVVEQVALRIGDDIRLRTAKTIVVALFASITLGSLVTFDWPGRFAGLLAFVGLVRMARTENATWARLPLAMLLDIQLLGVVPALVCPGIDVTALADYRYELALPIAAAAALSLIAWSFAPVLTNDEERVPAIAFRCVLRVLCVAGVLTTLRLSWLDRLDTLLAMVAFGAAALSEFVAGCRTRSEVRVWIGEAIAALGIGYLLHFGVLAVHHEYLMFTLLGVGISFKVLKECTVRVPSLAVLARPLGKTSFVMPLVAVAVGVARHFLVPVDWLGANSLAMLTAAAFYFWRGIEDGRKEFHLLAAAILNVALALLWRELAWSDPQFFMVPIGISIIALIELFEREIPNRFRNPLRYAGALVILVSPTFSIVGGSWIHLLTLMIASVAIVLLGIGLRVRALLYTGTAFLVADLVAIVVRGSVDNPNLLWIAGVLVGTGIVSLGAYCEKHREDLVMRMHLLSSTLRTWQ